ncbi:MAG: GntR family transcriptional regulator [Janthinobacterium lividum]
MSIEPVASNPFLVDVVYQRLLAAIIDCTLVPGQRIVQEEIAADLGVSRAPVSHALQLLKHHGLLQEAGRKGLEVVPIRRERVRDLYQVRAALDGIAARLAAERSANGSLSETETEALWDTFRGGAALGTDTAMSERVQADVDFHRALYRASGNASIVETLAPLWPHLQRAMVMVLGANQVRDRVWREHKHILDSILTGDPEGSDRAANRHATNAGLHTEEYLRTIERVQAPPRRRARQATP